MIDSDTAATAPTTIVLVHGAGMDHTVWAAQHSYLTDNGFQVLAVDLPGHGQSDVAPLKSIAEMAVWLGRFIEALDVSDVRLVGHSMGSFVALHLAASRPDLISSLVLMGTATSMPVHPKLLEAAENNIAKAAALVAKWSYGKPDSDTTPDIDSNMAKLAEECRTLVERSRPLALATDLRACASYNAAPKFAGQLDIPTTVILGAEDRMTPSKSGIKLASNIADINVLVIENTGHMMMSQTPEIVNHALRHETSP